MDRKTYPDWCEHGGSEHYNTAKNKIIIITIIIIIIIIIITMMMMMMITIIIIIIIIIIITITNTASPQEKSTKHLHRSSLFSLMILAFTFDIILFIIP